MNKLMIVFAGMFLMSAAHAVPVEPTILEMPRVDEESNPDPMYPENIEDPTFTDEENDVVGAPDHVDIRFPGPTTLGAPRENAPQPQQNDAVHPLSGSVPNTPAPNLPPTYQ
jgi:hypothetical protein